MKCLGIAYAASLLEKFDCPRLAHSTCFHQAEAGAHEERIEELAE